MGKRSLRSFIRGNWVIISLAAILILGSLALRQLDLNTPKLPLGKGVENLLDWAILYLTPLFDAIKYVVNQIFNFIEDVFLWVPWPVWTLALGFTGWYLVSLRTGILIAGCMLTIQAVGLWAEAMSTTSLIVVALISTVIFAIPLGILAAKNNTFNNILRPILDAMQTTPIMVYLIPTVMLLGIGKVPAVITTMIFSIPPTIRLTSLGLRQVPDDVKESARAFGASGWQLLTKVEIPLALRTIFTGINQSTMMAVSMVVISAFIGAGGLGYSVFFALDRVKIDLGFEAGLAVLAIAIVLDRLTQALGKSGHTKKDLWHKTNYPAKE